MKRKSKYFHRYRNAITGHWCSKVFAWAHPEITVRERFKRNT